MDVTGKSSDVITQGMLLESFSFVPGGVTVNGVSFPEFPLGPNQWYAGKLSGYGQFAGAWDSAYRSLLTPTLYVVNVTYGAVDMGVLAKGRYVVQVFTPQWDVDWPTIFSINNVDSDLVHTGGFLTGYPYPPRAKAQWVSAYIQSDGITPLTLRTKAVGTYQLWSAYQLRALTVPEPDSWALLILGFGMVGALTRRSAEHAPGDQSASRAANDQSSQPDHVVIL